MIDETLAERARLHGERPRPAPKCFPPTTLAAPSVDMITVSEDAHAVVNRIAAMSVDRIGFDTEFRARPRPDGTNEKDDWRDPSRCGPISVGVAVFENAGADHFVVHRFAFDVRTAATLASLARLFAVPVLFVAHNFRAELFTLKTLGLAFPKKFACTWLAAKLLNLGREHAKYENPEPEDEASEIRADEIAEAKRESGVSLLALIRRHGLPYRFAGDKDAMHRRYESLADGATLNAIDSAYVTADAEAAGALYPRLLALLEDEDLVDAYQNVELPGAMEFALMQWRGVRIDEHKRAKARLAAQRARAAAERVLEHYDFPIRENPERRVVVESRPALLRVLGAQRTAAGVRLLDLFRSKKAKSGYSITRDRLSEYRDVHPLLETLYRHRRYTSILKDKLFRGDLAGADGNVHFEVDPLGADTGRASYKRPNIVGLSRDFRPMIIPSRSGFGLAELDYSAEEIFIAAIVLGDPALLADVNAGDAYRRTATWLFEDLFAAGHELLTDDEFAKHESYGKLRKRAKQLTLGILYGMGIRAVAAKLGVSVARAKRLRERFFARYRGLEAGIARCVRSLEERGFARMITGQKRFRGIVGLLLAWEARWAINSPIQGSAAGLLKVLLARLAVLLAKVGAHVVVAPYDAVLVEYPLNDDGRRVLLEAAELMKSVFRELFPGTEPRVDINDAHPECWNDDGRHDAIDVFLTELGRPMTTTSSDH